MAKLTREDVLKLARLVRIDLTDAEIDEFETEFNEILQYVEQLQSVDISDYDPTSQVTGLANVTRKDEVTTYPYTSADLLKNVPHTQENQIKVKRMIG